ncbi:hypothetical protein R3P38DRAFT_2785706 [Favolaschia claudopus]|uniref:Uncharacterized protein n=1 Tax=Favolaschia claudopus TaxID=2862362 RepID=A0AAW0ATI7_9AGAR
MGYDSFNLSICPAVTHKIWLKTHNFRFRLLLPVTPSRPLVKRFLVDFVICVDEKDRLLYSERLHVHGKDRSYVTARFRDLLSDLEGVFEARSEESLWIRQCNDSGPFDVFEPEFIRHALESEEVNLGSLILGAEHWENPVLAQVCLRLPPAMSASWLNLGRYTYLFHSPETKNALRASHPLTQLYWISKSDIWPVIPAFPDNSAPILRARPPKPPTEKETWQTEAAIAATGAAKTQGSSCSYSQTYANSPLRLFCPGANAPHIYHQIHSGLRNSFPFFRPTALQQL